MSIVDEINGMVKIALTYDPRRLGGTMFAQRRKSPAVTASNASGAGQAGTVPQRGFGWTAGGAGSAHTAQTPTGTTGEATAAQAPATQTSAKAVSTPKFDFEAEARKIVSPFVRDFRNRPGAYSDRARGEYNSMMAKMRQDLSGVREGKMDEGAQRRLLQDWKKRISGFKGWRKGDSLTIGNNTPSPNDPNAGWKQVGRGIYIIPRKGNAGDSRSIERYAQRSNHGYSNELMQIADWAAKPTFKNKVRNPNVMDVYNNAVAEAEKRRRLIAQHNAGLARGVQVASK